MLKISRTWLFAAVGIIVIALVVVLFAQDAQKAKLPPAPPLVNTFDKSPTGFEFKYPKGWEYMIPIQGVLVTGPSETLYEHQPGPTLTVQRGAPISIPGSLDGAIDNYLQYGPMRQKGRWTVTATTKPTTLEGRDARVVELEGSPDDNTAPSFVRVIAVASTDTFVYLFVTTVPKDLRAEYESTLEAMLASVRLLE